MTETSIEDFCDFGGDNVYILMAIARKAENPVTSSSEIVFREVAKDEDDMRRKVNKLVALCEHYNPPDMDTDPTFRLYLSANARDPVSALRDFQARIDDWVWAVVNDDSNMANKMGRAASHWMSELQRPQHRAESRFLWDYDGDDLYNFYDQLHEWVEPDHSRATPNGFHVVTEPFNYSETNLIRDFDVELKTDGLLHLIKI